MGLGEPLRRRGCGTDLGGMPGLASPPGEGGDLSPLPRMHPCPRSAPSRPPVTPVLARPAPTGSTTPCQGAAPRGRGAWMLATKICGTHGLVAPERAHTQTVGSRQISVARIGACPSPALSAAAVPPMAWVGTAQAGRLRVPTKVAEPDLDPAAGLVTIPPSAWERSGAEFPHGCYPCSIPFGRTPGRGRPPVRRKTPFPGPRSIPRSA